MRLARVAVANVNSTVGAVIANTDRAIRLAREAADDGATLVAFQEQLIGGYPTEDLIQWQAFVDAQRRELLRFAEATRDLAAVFALGLTVAHEGHRFNCAAAVHRGRLLGFVPKEKLPTYNVFYEGRTFTRGVPGFFADAGGVPLGDLLFRFDFGTVALEVCEDLWSPDGPMRRRAYAGAEIAVNVSASPYRMGVQEKRRAMMMTRSEDCQVTLVYANAVGGQDSLIFDGGGFVIQNGRMLLDAPRFREGFASVTLSLDVTTRMRAEASTFRADWEEHHRGPPAVRVVEVAEPAAERGTLRLPPPPGKSFFLPPPASAPPPRTAFCEELLDALALGVGDYYAKAGAFRKIGVALSGGRDSLLTLLIAHRAVTRRGLSPAEVLQAFTMPSHVTGTATRQAAETICRELGVPLVVLPLGEAYERELAAVRAMLRPGEAPTPVTLQNIQARLRAQRMWNWANSVGALWLHTGNMTEKAVGYTTVGGDLEGGLSVLSNVPKTVVLYLLEYLHETLRLEGIRLTLQTVPGPELAPDQAGERELMPFPVLDACFQLYAGEKLSPADVLEALAPMFPEHSPERLAAWVDRFARLFTQSIYKWVQSPLSLHVGNLDLDRERALQIPVVQRSEWARKNGEVRR
jgi:NAD+ synthase (glutamine-hydrolysing)